MRRAGRVALVRAIRFTDAAGSLLLPAEFELSQLLNLGQLVDRIDLWIFLMRRDRLQFADRRLRTNRLKRRVRRPLERTRAQALRERAAAVAEQIRDQHLAHVLLGLRIGRDAVVLIDR